MLQLQEPLDVLESYS